MPQIGLAIPGSANRMFRFKQIVTMLLVLLSFSPVVMLNAASSDDQETITDEAMAFETHPIQRQNLIWFGKRKSRIGDFAEVTHKVGKMTDRHFKNNFNSDFEFSLHVATLEGAEVKLNGKNRTVYAPRDDDKGLLHDMVDFAVEEKWGISDVEMTYDAYESTYTATIATGDSPDDTWQFMVDRRWKAADMTIVVSGTLTNGSRTLRIESSSAPPTFESVAEIHEDGEVLCKRINGGEYEFRTGLSPELKLLLLAGMEILEVNANGDFW